MHENPFARSCSTWLRSSQLAAVLRHAHLVLLHPRDADAAGLKALLDAARTTPAIVTLSQIIAFIFFQAPVALA